MMLYLIYSFAEILFISGMIIIFSRFTKEIICHRCGEKFGAIPKRIMIIGSAIIFCQMVLVSILWNNELSFMCYLAGATCIYYLLKKEKFNCPNCKSVNQLNN